MSDPLSAGRKSFKRLILCCDGTWLNALGKEDEQPPSNVTRICRILKQNCHDGTNQIIVYHPGVGSSGSALDSFTGGNFGLGLDADIRDLYNFICNNYADGDDIILIGFSRGAFTARSVADMIASLGLLTPDGLDHFYHIFEDYENLGDKHRDVDEFLFPGIEPYNGQEGKARIIWEDDRKAKYRQWLKQQGYTRDAYGDGVTDIKVKAVGVWDTVGNLGIPPAPCTWRFTNTHVSRKVENAFQALALDEPRAAFRPALWERVHGNMTNLKQVWFPGSHSNIGGGWYDQQIANITLAWMCDQLSSVGVEFDVDRVTAVFMHGLRYSAAHPFPYVPAPALDLSHSSHPKPWANKQVFEVSDGGLKRDTAECDGKDRHPSDTIEQLWETARPWGLGQTRYPTSWLQKAVGTTVRHPGLFKRVEPETNEESDEPLLDTNETIHSSVRVRLACGGLGMDDKQTWECKPLTQDSEEERLWKIEQGYGFDAATVETVHDYVPRELREGSSYPEDKLYPVGTGVGRWRWVYGQAVQQSKEGDQFVPQSTVLPEEPLVGYWERLLLNLTVGKADVWQFAESNPPLTSN